MNVAPRSAGLGFVPRVTRGPAGPVLQIPVPAFIFRAPNGLGQTAFANPNACQYALPGLTPTPGLAMCNPSTGLPQGMTVAAPMACGGIPPGGAGYAQCMEQANDADIAEGYNPYVSGVNILSAAPVTAAEVATANQSYGAPAPVVPSVAGGGSTPPAAGTTTTATPAPTPAQTVITQGLTTPSTQQPASTTAAAASPFAFLEDTVPCSASRSRCGRWAWARRSLVTWWSMR